MNKIGSSAITGVAADIATRTQRRRILPNLFGIPFGIAGLSDAWSAAAATLGTSTAVPNALDILSAAIWVMLVGLYFSQGATRLLADLRDDVVSPFVSLIVITPMLLGAGLSEYAFDAGRAIVAVFLALTVLFGGWVTGQWIVSEIDQDKMHPGYFLPTVAGGLVAAYAAAVVGMHAIAEAVFGLGIACWFLLGSLILNRLFVRPTLAAAHIPTLAIEVAPPAVAGIAYFAINGGTVDLVATGLAGYTVLMALVQLRLIPLYVKQHFSAAFWAFTFPYAAVATDAAQWIRYKNPPGATAYAAIDVGLITAFIAAIFIRSAVAIARNQFLPPLPAKPAATTSSG